MKCKFCGSANVYQLNLSSFIEDIPAGLTRDKQAEFNGFQCSDCYSVENNQKFDPSKYNVGYYSANQSYNRVEYCYDYTGPLVPMLQKRQGDILELGAGQGALSGHLKQLDLNVAVLEPDIGYLNILRQNFDCVYSDIKYVDKRFDTVVSVGVLEHLTDPYDHICEVFDKILNENGIMICQFPNVRGLTARVNLKNWDMLYEAGHNFIPSVAGIKSILKSTDIKVVSSYTSSITSRGRIPFFPFRISKWEHSFKNMTNNYQLFDCMNKLGWRLQSRLGLGETTVVILGRCNS